MGNVGFGQLCRVVAVCGLSAALAGCGNKPSGTASTDQVELSPESEKPAYESEVAREAVLAYAKPPADMKTPMETCRAGGDADVCSSLCNAGDAEGCLVLARLSHTAPGWRGVGQSSTPESRAARRKWLEPGERNCRAGDARACSRAAWQWKNTNPRDKARAAELEALGEKLLSKNCENGDPTACKDILDALANEERRWQGTAAGVARRACDHGEWQGCELVVSLRKGEDGAESSPARARMVELAEKKCLEEFDLRACHAAGEHYRKGPQGERDARRSLRLHAIGCQQGDSFACELAAVLHDHDGPLPAPAIYRAFAERACALGSRPGCSDVSRLRSTRSPEPAAESSDGSAAR